ncbi:MAG: hypothetical protein GEU79_04540 [Acidimicrobiia bacterium]|nr:hypothetical protein [Acidimicrobiia bacterium]
MRKILLMGWIGLLRMFKDRSNWFFVFLMPVGIIVLVGVAFGGEGGPVSVGITGPEDMTSALVEEIDVSILDTSLYDDQASLEAAVAGGQVNAGVVIPEGVGEGLASGEQVEIGLLTPPEGSSPSVRTEVDRALGDIASERTIVATLIRERDLEEQAAQQALSAAQEVIDPSVVETRSLGEALFPPGLNQFYVGAAGMVVLFVFLTGLTGSAYLIQSRQLGVTTRVVSTPTSLPEIVIGEGTARWVIAFFQGVYIMVMTAVLFGVEWGDLLGGTVLLGLLAAVGGGAAMLVGSIFNNDQQTAGLTVMLSLGLGALGGCMFPLDLFPETMQTIAHFTPHAWALDGFNKLVYTGVGIGGILPELGVLAAIAVVLFGAASIVLSRKLVSGQ